MASGLLSRARLVVIALTAAFAARALLLILALPYGDPLDEIFHFGYAEFMATTGRIPRAAEQSVPASGLRLLETLPRATQFGGPKLTFAEYMKMPRRQQRFLEYGAFIPLEFERGIFIGANYETQQPPLMYALAAAVLRVTGRRINVRYFVVRLLAIAFATAAVPLAYAFFRRLFAKRAALGATLAFVTFPGAATFTARFTNDALAFPLAMALLVLIADMAHGRLTTRKTIALAAILAVALWTKLYFLVFVPAVVVAALFAPKPMRMRSIQRAAIAAAVAFLLIVPWLVHQYRDTGDWLGLQETKAARAAGLGLDARLASLPRAFSPVILVHFGRTFVSPGTLSAMGAPHAANVLATIGLAFAIIVPQFRRGGRSSRRARAWCAAGAALLFFLAAQIAHFTTFDALHIPAGSEGWYVLILLPVILAAAAAFGTRVPAWCFVAASAFFAAAGVVSFRFLGFFYAGGSHHSLFEVFARIGLLQPSKSLLIALAVAWFVTLVSAAAMTFAASAKWRRWRSRPSRTSRDGDRLGVHFENGKVRKGSTT